MGALLAVLGVIWPDMLLMMLMIGGISLIFSPVVLMLSAFSSGPKDASKSRDDIVITEESLVEQLNREGPHEYELLDEDSDDFKEKVAQERRKFILAGLVLFIGAVGYFYLGVFLARFDAVYDFWSGGPIRMILLAIVWPISPVLVGLFGLLLIWAGIFDAKQNTSRLRKKEDTGRPG